MHTVLLRPYYGLTLVYCTAFSSAVLSVSFNRVILSVFLFSGYSVRRSLVGLLSLSLLSGVLTLGHSLVYPMPYPLAYPFPVFLSSSSPFPSLWFTAVTDTP